MERSLASSFMKNESKFSAEGFVSSEKEMKIKLLQKDLAIQENQIDIMKEEISNLAERKTELKKMAKYLKSENAELASQLKTFCKLTEELKGQIEDKSNMNNILHEKLSVTEDLVSERDMKLKEKIEKEEKLIDTLQEADKLIVNLKKKLSNTSKRIDEQKETINEKSSEIQKLKEKNTEQLNEIKGLKVQSAKNVRKAKAYKDLEEQYNSIQEAMKIEDSFKRALEEKNKRLDEEINSLKEELKRKKLSPLKEESKEQIQRLKALESEFKAVSEDKSFYKKEVDRLESLLSSDRQEFLQDLKSIKLTLNGSENEEGLTTHSFDIIKEIKSFRKDFTLYKDLIATKDKELSDLKSSLKAQEMKIRDYELQLKEIKSQDQQLHSLKETIAQKSHEANEEFSKLNSIISAKNIEIEDLKGVNLELRSKMVDQNHTIDSFRGKYQCMQELLEQMKENSKEIEVFRSQSIGAASLISVLVDLVNYFLVMTNSLGSKVFFYSQIADSYFDTSKLAVRRKRSVFKKVFLSVIFIVFLKRGKRSTKGKAVHSEFMGKRIPFTPLSYASIEKIQQLIYSDIDFSVESEVLSSIENFICLPKVKIPKIYSNFPSLKRRVKEYIEEKKFMLSEFEKMQSRVAELENFTFSTLKNFENKSPAKNISLTSTKYMDDKENNSILENSEISSK